MHSARLISNWSQIWMDHALNYTEIQYSTPVLDTNYKSETNFDPRGMGQLYNLTEQFLNLVTEADAIPEGILGKPHDGFDLEIIQKKWPTLVTHYAGVLAIILIAALLASLLPIICFFFCCCRCAGRCGARNQPFEKKRDPCRRVLLGILLSGVTIVMLFGVVCAFVTNQYMDEGVYALPNRLETGIDDTRLYLDNTRKEIIHLLVDNFGELDATLEKVLNTSGEIVRTELAEASNAVALDNLTSVADGLERIQFELTEIDLLTQRLQENSKKLNMDLKTIRLKLTSDLNTCKKIDKCIRILEEYKLDNLKTSADFNELPNISDSLQTVSELLAHHLADHVKNGKKQFDDIKQNIDMAVHDSVPQIIDSIRTAGGALTSIANNITDVIDKIRSGLSKPPFIDIPKFERQYIRVYMPYRYYLDLAASTMLLVIVLCLTLGLFYGFCGRRPEGGPYGDDCCNKGTGARFLMTAVWLMFLSGSVLIVITLAHFLLGTVGYKGFCQPLREPKNNQMINILNDYARFSTMFPSGHQPPPNLNVSSLIVDCHGNLTIYEVLQLNTIHDIEEVRQYKEHYHIKKRIEDFKEKIRFEGNITILSNATKNQLLELANSPLSTFEFGAYTKLLEEDIVAIDLNKLASALQEASVSLGSRPPSISLNEQAHRLSTEQTTTVFEMRQDAKRLQATAESLQNHLRFNHASLIDLINLVTRAQIFLNNKGTHEVAEVASELAQHFLRHIDVYMDRVVLMIQRDVGRCYPLSHVYNATINATCDHIMKPLNGFWSAFAWCLVLFLFSIVLCVKLASLYHKSDPYPGPMAEAEYLYDAYADRDNMPLSNSPHDKKSHSQRYQPTHLDSPRGYEGPPGGGGGGSRGDPRYTDMAPKHWGPPRYATEYERPPPYYYPGPGPAHAD